MKILLLNPPFMPMYSRQSRSPCVTKGGTLYYPYFLAYTAGVLEKNGFEVKLLDAVAEGMGREETINFAADFKPNLLVADTSTPSIHNDVEVAEEIKKATGCFVVLVGTHPTNLPEETLKLGNIDAVAVGEYDYTVRDLAKTIEKECGLKKVDGLVFRKKGKIISSKKRELIKNLDELPFVSEVYKKHLNIKKYFYASLLYPQVTILTARGCPYNCSFCNAPFKNSYRARSIENVVKEFLWIQENLPEVKEVMIEDETFPANNKRTIELCRKLEEGGVELTWSCNARVNTDFETLKEMKETGCRLMCVGFESPEQSPLNSVYKGTTKEMQLEFMRNTRKLRMLVNGCFMLGLPGDTKETISKTVEFAKKLNPDTAQFYPLMVYPGTPAYEWAERNGYLATKDYSKWITAKGMHNTVVSRPGLTDMELVALCDEARRQFYFRASYIFSKMGQVATSPREMRRIFKSARRFLPLVLRGT